MSSQAKPRGDASRAYDITGSNGSTSAEAKQTSEPRIEPVNAGVSEALSPDCHGREPSVSSTATEQGPDGPSDAVTCGHCGERVTPIVAGRRGLRRCPVCRSFLPGRAAPAVPAAEAKATDLEAASRAIAERYAVVGDPGGEQLATALAQLDDDERAKRRNGPLPRLERQTFVANRIQLVEALRRAGADVQARAAATEERDSPTTIAGVDMRSEWARLVVEHHVEATARLRAMSVEQLVAHLRERAEQLQRDADGLEAHERAMREPAPSPLPPQGEIRRAVRLPGDAARADEAETAGEPEDDATRRERELEDYYRRKLADQPEW